MTLAIASYFYITNPFYIQNVLSGIDLATLRPDVDPEVFASPVFLEFMITVIGYTAIFTIGVIALFHTIMFYRCYLRKTAAIAYVKIYSALAAASLVMWFLYNVGFYNSLILIPALVYTCVFLAERQPPKAVDNVLINEK